MNRKDEIKQIIIVGHDNYGAREIFIKIVQNNPGMEFRLIITTGLYYKKSFLESIFKMLKEASFVFCFNRFIELLKYKIRNDTLYHQAKKMGIPTFFTDDINSISANRYIRQFKPDLIISTFTMHLYNKTTIDLPRVAAIGCHPSILPHYRGLEVFFWALANGEKSSGVSVFYLDEKIDAGKVIMQERFSIEKEETVESIYIKLTDIAGQLLAETLRKFKHNEKFSYISTVGKGNYYPMPTSACYEKFKKTGRKWR